MNRLWEQQEIGVVHRHVDVFLLDATGKYLGRLCCFNQCPNHKPECQVAVAVQCPFGLSTTDSFSTPIRFGRNASSF